uniref:Uncharacterized protein n=1 Tax=Spironucleus salmonicida TaxID=348837 RepID=V6LB45_9EUKA|eukprot:EST41642.1 Hypothetical protein SS50377_19002 [Spironucleus salmonicida]
MLLQYQFSSGIRCSTSPYATQDLLMCFLQHHDLHSFAQQQLISVCFRAYAPLLVPEDNRYSLNLMTRNIKQSTDKLELIIECLTNGYGEVFHLDSNAVNLSDFSSKIKQNQENLAAKQLVRAYLLCLTAFLEAQSHRPQKRSRDTFIISLMLQLYHYMYNTKNVITDFQPRNSSRNWIIDIQ